MLANGGHITGAAGARATTIALGMPRFLTPADERRLRRDPSIVIYDNPDAVAICVWDETSALCRKQGRGESRAVPVLPGCVDICPNLARTEVQLDALEAESDRLRLNASMSPKPIARSLLARAERNREIVDKGRSEIRDSVDE